MPARDEPPAGRLPADRLGSLGLPARTSGWVPDQPAVVSTAAPPAPVEESVDAGATRPLAGEALRAAIAARLPLWAADGVERAAPSTILLVLVALIAVLIVGIVQLRHHGTPGGSSYSSGASYGAGTPGGSASTTGSAPPDPTTDAASIVVDVGGRVRKPGLVTLPLGARIADAIDAAGGPLRRRELDRIDLAQRVSDGEFLLVGVAPSSDAPPGATSGSGADGSSSPVSLSTATLDQLETLPGVGPVTAQKIIDWRRAHGGFSSVAQLQQVPGIGPAHYAEISPLVTP